MLIHIAVTGLIVLHTASAQNAPPPDGKARPTEAFSNESLPKAVSNFLNGHGSHITINEDFASASPKNLASAITNYLSSNAFNNLDAHSKKQAQFLCFYIASQRELAVFPYINNLLLKGLEVEETRLICAKALQHSGAGRSEETLNMILSVLEKSIADDSFSAALISSITAIVQDSLTSRDSSNKSSKETFTENISSRIKPLFSQNAGPLTEHNLCICLIQLDGPDKALDEFAKFKSSKRKASIEAVVERFGSDQFWEGLLNNTKLVKFLADGLDDAATPCREAALVAIDLYMGTIKQKGKALDPSDQTYLASKIRDRQRVESDKELKNQLQHVADSIDAAAKRQ